MAVLMILVAVALATVALLLWVVRGSRAGYKTAEKLESRLQRVDLAAFLNLTDEAETAYLQRLLPPVRFRVVQRGRIIATYRYLSVLFANAGILLQMGESAVQSDDSVIAESRRELSRIALQTRLLVLRAYLKLLPELLHPSGKPGWRPDVVTNYVEMNKRVVRLVGSTR